MSRLRFTGEWRPTGTRGPKTSFPPVPWDRSNTPDSERYWIPGVWVPLVPEDPEGRVVRTWVSGPRPSLVVPPCPCPVPHTVAWVRVGVTGSSEGSGPGSSEESLQGQIQVHPEELHRLLSSPTDGQAQVVLPVTEEGHTLRLRPRDPFLPPRPPADLLGPVRVVALWGDSPGPRRRVGSGGTPTP